MLAVYAYYESVLWAITERWLVFVLSIKAQIKINKKRGRLGYSWTAQLLFNVHLKDPGLLRPYTRVRVTQGCIIIITEGYNVDVPQRRPK